MWLFTKEQHLRIRSSLPIWTRNLFCSLTLKKVLFSFISYFSPAQWVGLISCLGPLATLALLHWILSENSAVLFSFINEPLRVDLSQTVGWFFTRGLFLVSLSSFFLESFVAILEVKKNADGASSVLSTWTPRAYPPPGIINENRSSILTKQYNILLHFASH